MRTIIGAAALALAGCNGTAAEEPATCDGGGTPGVTMGGGGQQDFVGWADGDSVEITQQGDYGFRVELVSAGLDTTSTITAFIRYSLGAATTTEDVGGTLTFQCNDDGTGWTNVFTTLGDANQTPDAVAALDGVALHVTVTATDQAADEADQALELVLQAP